MSESDVARQLDAIITLLKLAYRDEIERARQEIRSDRIDAAVLDGAKRWVPAGKLTKSVVTKTRAGSSTVGARIADLVAMGLLEKQGGGPTTEYRATGII